MTTPSPFLRPTRRLVIALMIPFCAGAASAADLPTGAASSPTTASSADVVLLATYVLLALVFSFLCSIAEAVLLSITPSYIAGLKTKQPALAALLKQLKQDNVDRSLAAILTLNTIAHTVGAIGSGSKATAVFGSAWFGLFSAAMTLMILFLSEIIPKTIGAVHWRALAGLTARFVRLLIWSLYPLILISESLTRLVAGGRHANPFNRDEFIAMAGLGERSGMIQPHESQLIRNLFRFGSLTARDIMTPRTVITALPQQLTVAEALSVAPRPTVSRVPVYDTDLDHITGFILRDDLLLAKAEGDSRRPLEALKRPIQAVPGNMPLPRLFEVMLHQRRQMVLVVDEYGGTRGLVTTEDVLETLLGMEIVDEMDRVDDMQALAREQWRKRARALGVSDADIRQALAGPTDAPETDRDDA